MDDNQFLQAVLPAAKSGLGVSSSRLLALPTFLALAVGAKYTLNEIFGLEHVEHVLFLFWGIFFEIVLKLNYTVYS